MFPGMIDRSSYTFSFSFSQKKKSDLKVFAMLLYALYITCNNLKIFYLIPE